MKRALMLVIVAGTVLGLMLPGVVWPQRRSHYWLPVLAALLKSDGARVLEYDLEGWATLQGSADPGRVMGLLQGRLGLARSPAVIGSTTWGQAWQTSGVEANGAAIQLLIQNEDGQFAPRRSYCVIRCRLPAGSQPEQVDGRWEQRILDALQLVGGERHLYLTVWGEIPQRLGLQAQQTLGRSLCQSLGGQVGSCQQTGQYLSLTGYSPLLPDLLVAGGSRININVALVNRKNGMETQVYLGTPIITTEY